MTVATAAPPTCESCTARPATHRVTVAGADFAVCQSCLPQPAALRIGDVIADMVPAGTPAIDWCGTLSDRRWWAVPDRRRPVLLMAALIGVSGVLAVAQPALVFVAAPGLAVLAAVWDWRALKGASKPAQPVGRQAAALPGGPPRLAIATRAREDLSC